MEKFIYVYSDESRDKLTTAGYQLVSGDTQNHIYAFLNRPCEKFATLDVSYILSDTLRL